MDKGTKMAECEELLDEKEKRPALRRSESRRPLTRGGKGLLTLLLFLGSSRAKVMSGVFQLLQFTLMFVNY